MPESFSNSAIEELAHKYRKGILTQKERADFEFWYSSFDDSEFVHSDYINPENVKLRMFKSIQKDLGFVMNEPIVKKMLRWKRFAVAASIVLALGIGIAIFTLNQSTEKINGVIAQNDVRPGKNAATLTLSNGKKILIGEVAAGEVAEDNGVKISKTIGGELVYTLIGIDNKGLNMQSVETFRGEQQAVILPDGSKVKLNAASVLKYPSSFTSLKNRNVELIGEAYFEVAKDASHPFIVSSAGQDVEVLGTHFNVMEKPISLTPLHQFSIIFKFIDK